jgi:hypothetical protein
MLEFIRSVYRGFVLVGFWIILIGFKVGGGILGNVLFSSRNYWSGQSSGGHPIIGGIIGLIVGFIIDILICGFIATILNIDDNLEQIKNEMKRNNSSGASSLNIRDDSPLATVRRQEEKICKRCGKMVDSGYSACPHCGGAEFK